MARMRLFLGLWLVLLGCSLLPPVEPSTEELLVGTWVNERPERMPGWESPDIPFLLRETLSLREDDGWSSTKQWTLWGEVKGTDLENGTYQVDADTLLRLVQASTTDVLPGTLLEDLVVSVDRTTLTLRCLSPIEDSILEYERQDGKRE